MEETNTQGYTAVNAAIAFGIDRTIYGANN